MSFLADLVLEVANLARVCELPSSRQVARPPLQEFWGRVDEELVS